MSIAKLTSSVRLRPNVIHDLVYSPSATSSIANSSFRAVTTLSELNIQLSKRDKPSMAALSPHKLLLSVLLQLPLPEQLMSDANALIGIRGDLPTTASNPFPSVEVVCTFAQLLACDHR